MSDPSYLSLETFKMVLFPLQVRFRYEDGKVAIPHTKLLEVFVKKGMYLFPYCV